MGEIVNTLGVGPFEGYYRNEEAMRRTHAQRLVLERRPRLRRRRWLGVLRRAHVRLAASGRRELPGGSDRGHHRPPPRRHDGVGLRRARRRFGRSGHGGPGAARGGRVRRQVVRRPGWTSNPISARNGGPRFVRLCKPFPPPRPTRSSPARSSTRSSVPTWWVEIRCMCAHPTPTPFADSAIRTKTPCAARSSPAGASGFGTCEQTLVSVPVGGAAFGTPPLAQWLGLQNLLG